MGRHRHTPEQTIESLKAKFEQQHPGLHLLIATYTNVENPPVVATKESTEDFYDLAKQVVALCKKYDNKEPADLELADSIIKSLDLLRNKVCFGHNKYGKPTYDRRASLITHSKYECKYFTRHEDSLIGEDGKVVNNDIPLRLNAYTLIDDIDKHLYKIKDTCNSIQYRGEFRVTNVAQALEHTKHINAQLKALAGQLKEAADCVEKKLG
jgi:hypothetical protein